MADAPAFDALATPVARLDPHRMLAEANPAFGRWLGVGHRRLRGLPLEAIDEAGTLASALDRAPADTRLRRVRLRAPGGGDTRFCDAWLTACEGGWRLEAHPVDEFPGDDPARLLPAALSASLRGLAHELRNPLAGLKGAAQLLARRVTGDADARALVELIDDEVARLAGLVDALLTPTAPRPHAPLNIHAVLERVLRLAEVQAGWAVRLVRDYDPSLPGLEGDADRLVQAAWNLVRNAIEAGASTVTLRTRAEHAPRSVRSGVADAPLDDIAPLSLRIEIIDDGRGVPEDMAERLFLPLVSGRAEGTGLGLALAQQVAREHGGSLAYRSRTGHTVFVMLLPMGEASRDPGTQGQEPSAKDAKDAKHAKEMGTK